MKKILFSTDKSLLSMLLLRLTTALTLLPHGAQKMLGWFGGYGFTGTMSYFTEVKNIPYPVALLVILIEFFGPLFLIFGLGTRLVAVDIIVNMTGIILSSHTQYGFFMNWFGTQQGKDLNTTS
ncbi:MAG: DoxX family protein [Chitinophagales bacterium]|nr:DoxX family protein [Chitinophagales bacterium]